MACQKQTLGYSTQSYQLYLNNRDVENKTSDGQSSSASDFENLILPELEISNLIFMKATEAEVSLNDLTIDNICLTFCQTEKIECTVKINTDHNSLNHIQNNRRIATSCQTPMEITMSDFRATTNEEGISYLNSILKQNVNHLIVQKYLMNFLDWDIFSSNFLTEIGLNGHKNVSITRPEYKIIRRYADVAQWVRKLLNSLLISKMTGDIPKVNVNVAPHTYSNFLQDKATVDTIHANSQNLRGPAIINSSKKLIDFVKFQDKNLENANNDPTVTLLANNIGKALDQWLLDTGIGFSEEELQEYYRELQKSNFNAIKQGLVAMRILAQEKRRAAINLFNQDFLTIKIDDTKQKVKFQINKTFLADDDTELTIIFPEHASYVLGVNKGADKNPSKITIGPIKYNQIMPNPLPLLTNHFLSESQRAHSCLRFQPKMINVTSDLITTGTRNHWLQHSSDIDCNNVLATIFIDQEMKDAGFIYKNPNENRFFKLQSSKMILDKFRIQIRDENMQKCIFSRHCFVTFALTIRPLVFEY